MKILVYSSVFYPAVGGIENLAMFLVREFIKAGHEVKVITEQAQDKKNPFKEFEIVESKNVIGQIRLYFWCDLMFMPNITLKGMWLKLINPFKPLVISHNDFHMVIFKNWRSTLKLKILRFATNHISVCKAVAKVLPVNAKVIYNGYDDQIFKIYPDETKQYDLIFSGRLVEQKGCEVLINACSHLKIPYTLNIVGDGREMDKLKALVKAKEMEESVKFWGFIKNEALARMMNRHKIMVIPSQYIEGFPLSALEGLACGCQMIVSDSGGLPEAVDKYGKVFKMEDQETLTAMIHDSLVNYKGLNDSAELKAYLSELVKEKVAGRYIEVFKESVS